MSGNLLTTDQSSNWIIDTHCHLDFDTFDEDREDVIENAIRKGVVSIINPGITVENSVKILQNASRREGIYAAVGVHPNEGSTWTVESAEKLYELAQNERVVAIGEIGLDYYWLKLNPQLQKQIFQDQLHIAETLGLPVIIHNRDATEDIITVLHNWSSAIKSLSVDREKPFGVLHSFSGSLEDAMRVTQLGFMIGIGGPVTFRNAQALVEVVRGLPMNTIVIETDSPFLSPHPFRGKRNEPGRVRLVAEKIAEIKGLAGDEVCRITTENASRLFRGKVRVNHG